MMQLKSLVVLLLSALRLFNLSSAFSVSSSHSRSPRTVLQSASVNNNDKEKSPRWIDSPRPRERVDNEKYSNLEMGIGRVAMVGFIGLLANEVISGESFSQQILCALVRATGHQ
jgi:hypothetical protein